jgi:hypothetical protein
MWHKLKTCSDFRFLTRVWCSMLAKVDHWAPEEKCFQSSIRKCEKCQVDTEWRLALNRGVAKNWSHQFLASENQGDIHAEEQRCIQLDTSRNSQCHNEKWFWLPLASTWHSRDARVQDWKHFSSPLNATKQGATLASMEHQTLDKNLKLTEVSNSCHIYGLLFYDISNHNYLRDNISLIKMTSFSL